MSSFHLNIHQGTLLFVKFGYYLCIAVVEPSEYCLFCLVFEKKEYLVLVRFVDNLSEINR